MAGETLTEKQRIFLQRYLKSGLFSGSHNKKVTGDYEKYVQVEAEFKAVILELPSADPRVKTVAAKSGPAMSQKNSGKFTEAAQLLAPVIREAKELKQTIITEYGTAVDDYRRAIDGLPLGDAPVVAITDRAAGLLDVGAVGEMGGARQTLVALKAEAEDLKRDIAEQKTDALRDLGKLTDPAGASTHEKAEMKARRDAVNQAMHDDYPETANFATARKEMAALQKLIRTAEQLAKLPAGTAESARSAFEGFDTILGDLEITPQVVTDAVDQRAQAENDYLTADDALRQAQALPEGTEQEQQQKAQAINQAQVHLQTTRQQLQQVTQRSNAIIGKQKLTEAVTFGALSPDAGRPLSENASKKIIDAYAKHPDIADTALDLAKRSNNPDLLANALPDLCQRNDNNMGFVSPGAARDYTNALLKQGDHLGGSYFDDMKGFLDRGGHYEPSPVGQGTGDVKTDTANRTRALAGSMLDSNGELTLDSSASKHMVEHLRFGFDCVLNPTPVLTDHIMHTFEQLKVGDRATEAESLIAWTSAPMLKPATTLVAQAVGKGPDEPVTDEDTKIAILKGLLTPMDQGPVGSCFTTAPARRFREENPIGVLTGLTEVATQGAFTCATGLRVPAVSNPAPGEDPILRSWEYSVASAAATLQGSDERNILAANLVQPDGLGKLVDILVPDGDPVKSLNVSQSIQVELRDAFTFQYNPQVAMSTPSTDGSSTSGRYQIVETDEFGAPTGDPISTPDKFVEVMTGRMLKKLSVDPTSPEGIAIADHLRNEMIEEVVPTDGKPPYKRIKGTNDYKPWELNSGGWGLGPTKALEGPSVRTDPMVPLHVPPPDELDIETRSKQVLVGVLSTIQTAPDKEYLTIDSRGHHEFNALPKDPSMTALVGSNATETENKVNAFIQKGRDVANQEIPGDRAAWFFDRQVQEWIDRATDPTTKQEFSDLADQKRPKGSEKLTPAQLNARILEVNHVIMDKMAEAAVPTPGDVETYKKDYREFAERQAQKMLLTDLAPPQVTIADSNWGDGGDHTYFVMMVDPLDGKMKMWQRTDPPGDLALLDKTWVDNQWHITR